VASGDLGARTARLVGGACALVLALGAATVAGVGFGAPVPGPVKVRAFSISGGVADLFPGASAPLVLTVKNARSFPITVSSITTTVKKSAGGCPASEVNVSAFTGSLQLQPKQTGTAQVTVTMPRTAPRACEGRTFFFEYRGLGGAP
jgi:hypothetical protein